MIDKELDADKPFDFDFTLAGDDVEEYVYADAGGKILNYMIAYGKPIKLSSIVMLRHNVGVNDKVELLGGFNELVVKKLIESRVAKNSNELEYKATGEFKSNRDRGRKDRTKSERFALLQKLKVEFKDEEGE